MSENETNPGCVFPSERTHLRGSGGFATYREAQIGLTKRELFAAMAMQGLLADGFGTASGDKAPAAALAVGHADALLSALAVQS